MYCIMLQWRHHSLLYMNSNFQSCCLFEVIVYSACVFLLAVDAVELKGNLRAREPRYTGEQDPTEYNCPDRMTVECTCSTMPTRAKRLTLFMPNMPKTPTRPQHEVLHGPRGPVVQASHAHLVNQAYQVVLQALQ